MIYWMLFWAAVVYVIGVRISVDCEEFGSFTDRQRGPRLRGRVSGRRSDVSSKHARVPSIGRDTGR